MVGLCVQYLAILQNNINLKIKTLAPIIWKPACLIPILNNRQNNYSPFVLSEFDLFPKHCVRL